MRPSGEADGSVTGAARTELAPPVSDQPLGHDLRAAAVALHRLLLERHWRGDGLIGPDCGIRLNYRVGRFVKSYLRGFPWRDDLYYLQAQGYWVLACWLVRDLTEDEQAGDVAQAAARGMISRQRGDGAWDYPNREWRGRVANAEGTWAAIGLVETYRRTGEDGFLEAALRWHRFLEQEIGYRVAEGGLAVNYFAGATGAPVPNNSAFVLRLLAELADATGEAGLRERAPALLAFLAQAQLSTGELPYQVGDGARHFHFQCPQYNAFQCLDLIRYHELTGESEARSIVTGLLRFLGAAVDGDGAIPYACDAGSPQVSYHLAAVAAALGRGAGLGEPGCAEACDRAVRRLLAQQQSDGGFVHSRADYGILTDRRSYPRHLAMLLYHLLLLAAPDRTAREPFTGS